jgi:hypothetical protein
VTTTCDRHGEVQATTVQLLARYDGNGSRSTLEYVS